MEKRYWFRNKRYGYGWEPCSWEGGLVTVLYIVGLLYVVVGQTLRGPLDNLPTQMVVQDVIAPIVLLTAIFIAISWRTGEAPKWQWGKKKDTKKNEVKHGGSMSEIGRIFEKHRRR